MDLEKLLQLKLNALHVEVEDESHRHAGHGNFKGQAGSHFRVLVVSSQFEKKTLIERHRLVNAAVFPEFEGQIHALAIRALSPSEWKP